MDWLKRMRQRDWARVFGALCAVVAVGLSLRGYAGADWDALILLLGALMLLRGAVEGPTPSRVAGLLRAGRLVLLMLAFGAVNRAQGGVEGAVAAVLGNPILWAVAALLFALPLLRRGMPWQAQDRALAEIGFALFAGIAFWLLFGWLQGVGDMAALRSLVATAAVVNGAAVLRSEGKAIELGLALWVTLICVVVLPGAVIWPVALACLPVCALYAVVRHRGFRIGGE